MLLTSEQNVQPSITKRNKPRIGAFCFAQITCEGVPPLNARLARSADTSYIRSIA
jgi:hypothetical protein